MGPIPPPAGSAADQAADQGADPDKSRPPRGVDLAKAALAAAREGNAKRRAAAGRTPLKRAGGAAALRRRRWAGPGPDYRDPQPLGAVLKKVLAEAGAGADLKKATIFGRWEQIVGADLAAHCRPMSLIDGELVLQAESTAWATQIRLLAPVMQRTINAEVGRGSVTRISARGPSGPSWRFGLRHVPGRGPRDTYG